jgi:hypothetical protein
MDWADGYWGTGWYDFSAEEIAQLQTRDMDDPEYRARPSSQYDTRGWKEYYSYAMSEHRPG